MCGIVVVYNQDNAKKKCVEILKRLEYRGYDSQGIYCWGGEQLPNYWRGKDLNNLCDSPKLKYAIGHNRWASQGNNNSINWQPLLNDYFCVAHNGDIENIDEFDFICDPEIDYNENNENSELSDTNKFLNSITYGYTSYSTERNLLFNYDLIKGNNVLVIRPLDADNDVLYILITGNKQFYYNKEDKLNLLCSDSQELGYHCNTLTAGVYRIQDNKITKLNGSKEKVSIGRFNPSSTVDHRSLNVQNDKVNVNLRQCGKTETQNLYFTQKLFDFDIPNKNVDIFKSGDILFYNKQTDSVSNKKQEPQDHEIGVDITVPGGSCIVQSSVTEKEFVEQEFLLSKKYDYRSKFNSNILFLGCGSSYHAGLLLSYYLDNSYAMTPAEFLNKRFSSKFNEIILISQSGETQDLINCLDKVNETSSNVKVVTNNPHSFLASQASILDIQCGPEYGVAATKSLTSTINLLSQYFGGLLPCSFHKNKVGNFEIKENIFILGEGPYEAIAKEAALKFKELCYIHAEGMGVKEFKHGPLALIDNSTVIVLNNYAQFVKNRCFHYYELHGDPISCLISLQRIVLEECKKRNINPDRPRHLAKSITV